MNMIVDIVRRYPRTAAWTAVCVAVVVLAGCGDAKMTPEQAFDHCAEQVDNPFDERFTACLEDNADTSDPEVREGLEEMRGAHDQLEGMFEMPTEDMPYEGWSETGLDY